MKNFLFLVVILKLFTFSDVFSKYILVKVESKNNNRYQHEISKYYETNEKFFETGHDYEEEYGTFENETLFSSGSDLEEVGGCKCDCRGECEPKGCRGLSGRSMSRSLGGIIYLFLQFSNLKSIKF